jgi:hypothetical protein
MTGSAPLAFPGSRTLADWWRRLTGLLPRGGRAEAGCPAYWVGHLLVHRVEARVRVSRPVRPDRLTRLALVPLALESDASPEQIQAGFPLERPALEQVLRRLEADGLAVSDRSGRWRLTELGRRAGLEGEFARTFFERQAFFFLDGGGSDRSPAFIPLDASASDRVPTGERYPFDLRWLTACVGQPVEWKRRRGFPLDVEEVVEPDAQGEQADLSWWQRLVVVETGQSAVLLLRTPDGPGAGRLRAFAVENPSCELNAATPVLDLGEAWPEVLPELATEPTVEQWRQAWRERAQTAGLSPAQADACRLTCVGRGVRVAAPRTVTERLRPARRDRPGPELWLLAGEGRIRAAAPVDLDEIRAKP